MPSGHISEDNTPLKKQKMTQELYPSGEYVNNTANKTKSFTTTSIPTSELTTNGTTTGPSEYVLNAGMVDRDRPSDFDPTNPLSLLRARLTVLQDEVNGFLTKEMINEGKDVRNVEDIEKKLLDGADSDSDDE